MKGPKSPLILLAAIGMLMGLALAYLELGFYLNVTLLLTGGMIVGFLGQNGKYILSGLVYGLLSTFFTFLLFLPEGFLDDSSLYLLLCVLFLVVGMVGGLVAVFVGSIVRKLLVYSITVSISPHWSRFREWNGIKHNHDALSIFFGFVGSTAAVSAVIGAVLIGVWQNQINSRLLSLEETSREPILLINFDDAHLDESGNFSGQVHFQNIGNVPVSNIKYQVSDFATSTTPSQDSPYTYSNDFYKGKLHQFAFQPHGVVIAPGQRYSVPIYIGSLKISNAIPTVWAGITFTRYPDGPRRCIERTYVPLDEYKNSPSPSTECGPWWPEFEIIPD